MNQETYKTQQIIYCVCMCVCMGVFIYVCVCVYVCVMYGRGHLHVEEDLWCPVLLIFALLSGAGVSHWAWNWTGSQ